MNAKPVDWIAFLLGAAILVAHNVYVQPWTLDDAFISFRYADNFAEGKGLVYNEGERVEGYTTFLWVFLLGLGRLLGFETVALAKGSGLILGLATLLLVSQAHRLVPNLDRSASALGVVLAATSGIFTGWIMSGMEVALVGFLVTLSFVLHLRARAAPDLVRRSWAAGICCALVAMSRPEYGLLFAVLFVDRLFDGLRNRNRAFLHFALAFAAVYVPYFAWRYWYYGWLFPNTFYAKVGKTWAQVERGARYTRSFSYPAALVLTPVAIGVVLRKYGGFVVLPAWMLVHAVCVIVLGGDVWPAYRFYSPMIPIAALAAGVALARTIHRPDALAGFLVAAVAFNAYQTTNHWSIHDQLTRKRVGNLGKVTGLWLREYASPDAVLATNTAGGLAYYSELKVIDMLGLNDAHIAHRQIPTMGADSRPGHEKGDGQYVLSRKPDFIQFGSVRGSILPKFPSDLEIFRSEEFKKWYALRTHDIPGPGNIRLYERLDEPRTPAEIAADDAERRERGRRRRRDR